MGQALYYDFQGNAMVRIQGPERPLLLQIAADRRNGTRSLFTLHSASGYARRSGDVELVKIAGFCHSQNKLRNVMMQSIQSVVDPSSGEIIEDLAGWMERLPHAGGQISPAPGTQPDESEAARRETMIEDEFVRV